MTFTLLTEEQIQTLCLFGKGEVCCSFLMNGPGGWACAKGSEFETWVQERRDAGTIRAMGNHCSGPPEFKPEARDDSQINCQWCDEVVFTLGATMHRECAFRAAVGSVAHVLHWCSCYQPNSTLEDPPGLSKREAARAALELSQQLMNWFGPGPR